VEEEDFPSAAEGVGESGGGEKERFDAGVIERINEGRRGHTERFG
jgi:hypothetical protein